MSSYTLLRPATVFQDAHQLKDPHHYLEQRRLEAAVSTETSTMSGRYWFVAVRWPHPTGMTIYLCRLSPTDRYPITINQLSKLVIFLCSTN